MTNEEMNEAKMLERKFKEYDRRINRCKATIERLSKEQDAVGSKIEAMCEKLGLLWLW